LLTIRPPYLTPPFYALLGKNVQLLHANMPAGVVPQGQQALKLTIVSRFSPFIDILTTHKRVGLWLEKQFTTLRDELVAEQSCLFSFGTIHICSMYYYYYLLIPCLKPRECHPRIKKETHLGPITMHRLSIKEYYYFKFKDL
jgi:hypothetical protein